VRDSIRRLWISAPLGVALLASHAAAQDKDKDPNAAPPQADAKAPALPGPMPIPEEKLGPVLKTTPMQRRPPGPNETFVEASVLPKDRQGIWILDFMFKPVRMITVEVNGKRKNLYYLYYRVVNRTGKPRMFVPQFTLVTNTGKRYEDSVIPQAIPVIQKREDLNVDLYGAVDVIGIIPPSTKEGVDDTITGVAVWEDIDPHADAFKLYIRGMSDGYQKLVPPGGGTTQPVIRDKTLRIDFSCPGAPGLRNEHQIHLADPAYEWIYWGDRPDPSPIRGS
jgi:hypothetical protein